MSKTTSRRAVLAGAADRAEQLIHMLRTCHVREGWQIDEESAERVLAYFRDGAPDDDRFQCVIDFCDQHNQSLDWIFCGNPGVMICQLAAQASGAVGARS
jgi:hypothetical protein